ncbi:MAG TPA: hypothetical protein VGN97_12290 [Mesorhizobium sp.]|nr:hypothetical protein [Mesorhizobium sp.]
MTGFAWYDTRAELSAIEAGSFRIGPGDYEQRAGEMGSILIRTIKPRRPDFVAIEQPVRNVMPQRKHVSDFAGERDDVTINAGTALLLNQLTGAAAAIIRAYSIPFEVIPPATWRKQFLGFGRRPGWVRKDWKRATRERCQQLRIHVTNDDQADAVGVAFAGSASQAFKMTERSAAA